MRTLKDLDYTSSDKEVADCILENSEFITSRYSYYLNKTCKKKIDKGAISGYNKDKKPKLLNNYKVDFNDYVSLYVVVYLERYDDYGMQEGYRIMSDAFIVIRVPKSHIVLYPEKNRFVVYKLTCLTQKYSCINFNKSEFLNHVFKIPWHYIHRFI